MFTIASAFQRLGYTKRQLYEAAIGLDMGDRKSIKYFGGETWKPCSWKKDKETLRERPLFPRESKARGQYILFV
jgi:hypothetical protein